MNESKDLKAQLRYLAIENFFKTFNKNSFPSYMKTVLKSFIGYDDVLDVTLSFLQQRQSLILLINVLDILSTYFGEHREKSQDLDLANKILQTVIDCIETNANTNSAKIDDQILQFLFNAAKLSSIFSQQLPNLLQPMPTNPYFPAFILITNSFNQIENDVLYPLVEPFFTSKLTLSPNSIGTIYMMSTHKEVKNSPTLKSLIAFFKSLSDKNIIHLLTPIIIRAALLRLSTSTIKEMPTLIIFLCSKFLEKDENTLLLCQLIGRILDMSDSISIVKPFYEQLFKVYLTNVRNDVPFISNLVDIDNEDPLKYINVEIAESFCVLMNSCSVNPFDSFFTSRLDKQTINTILLMIYIINNYSNETKSINFTESTFDPILLSLKSYAKKLDIYDPISRMYCHLCGFIIDHFDSKQALNILIQGLEMNSTLASTILINHSSNYQFVFPHISRNLKPGKSSDLLITTLKEIIRNNFPQSDSMSSSTSRNNVAMTSTDDESTTSNTTSAFEFPSYSESMNFDLPDLNRNPLALPDTAIETPPTDATILFCCVITSLNQFPYLYSLLPYSASAISPSFSASLMSSFPHPKSSTYKVDVLCSFSNASMFLDISDIYSLSQTFMMLLPGQAMLFLAITLQRLPADIAKSLLLKTIPFIWNNSDETGRMIALVSHTHQEMAIEFIENVISNSTLRRKSFFSFRSSETNEQALIVIFKIIGYCSSFLDINFFNSHFLSYSISFLNKYLTHQSKSPFLYSASLFAIKKLSNRIQMWQDEHIEHLFPFKDFLVQYVCSYYLDLGDTVLCKAQQTPLVPNQQPSQQVQPGTPLQNQAYESNQNNESLKEEITNTDEESMSICDVKTYVTEESESGFSPLIPTKAVIQIDEENETSFKNISRVLQALSSLLPLKPIRPYDKHEKSVELTNVLIQVSDDQHFNSIYKAAKLFFCTLLDCNQSLTVFMKILMPIFPTLLAHSQWRYFASLMEYICTKYWSSLNIHQNSDALSKVINNIGILVSHAIPLTLQQTEVKEKAVNIVFSLINLQCSIRNQILSLPQSIRPQKPETENKTPEEINTLICNFLAKSFTTSQTFEVILTLLSFFREDNQMLHIHHVSVATCIKKLLSERGSEEFRFDGKITSAIVEAYQREPNAVDSIFIEIIGILMKMRSFSMLSSIIMLNRKIKDDFFQEIMKCIMEMDDGQKKILNMIAGYFDKSDNHDEKEMKRPIKFAYRALPYLSQSMNEIDNDTWSKIFIGIAKRSHKMNDPHMKCLVSNENYDGYFGFAKIVARDRLLALQAILSSFPENPSKLLIKIAIAFASTDSETCEGFLNYSISALLRKAISFSPFSMLQKIFESDSIDSKCWMPLSESFSALFIQNMRMNKKVVDCTISYLNHVGENELQEFWMSFSEICRTNVEKWAIIIKQLFTEGKVHFPSIAAILPEIVIHINKYEFQQIIKAIADKMEIPFDDQNIDAIFDSCQEIMTREYFTENNIEFLRTFVSLLEYRQYELVCCNMIQRLCVEINEDNAFAVSSLINRIKLVKNNKYTYILDLLMRLL